LSCAAGATYFATGPVAKRAHVRFVSHEPDRMTTPGRTFASGEDKPVNQKVSVQVFEKGGHRVTAAGNGCEAIGSYAEAEIRDLILMGPGNGWI